MKNFLQRFPVYPLLTNSGWMLLGYGARVALHIAAFILLARSLGPQGYGTLMASLALVGFIAPFVELGAYSRIVQDVAGGVPLPRAIGSSLTLMALGLCVGLTALAAAKPLVLPHIAWDIPLSLGLAGFLSGSLYALANGANVAQGALWRTALIEVGGGLTRLFLVILLPCIGGDVGIWSYLSILHAVTTGGLALLWTVRSWGPPTGTLRQAWSQVHPGLQFALGAAAQNAYTDLDKTIIARLSTLEATGVYSAAQRVIATAFIPLAAFLGAVYPRFFAAGTGGLPEAWTLAKRVLPFTSAYGLLAGAGIWVLAPWIAWILGSGFSDTGQALRLMALLLPIQGLLFPLADAMTGSGMQRVRNTIQLGALALNLLLNLWSVPRYGWLGAAWATLCTQLVMVVSLWTWGQLRSMRMQRERVTSVLHGKG